MCFLPWFSQIALLVVVAVVCATAIPAGPAQARPIAPLVRERRAQESEQLTSGADDDLKGSNSYGYGYYGSGLGGYGGYGGLGGYGGYGGLGYGGYPGYSSLGGYGYPLGYSYYSCELHQIPISKWPILCWPKWLFPQLRRTTEATEDTTADTTESTYPEHGMLFSSLFNRKPTWCSINL